MTSLHFISDYEIFPYAAPKKLVSCDSKLLVCIAFPALVNYCAHRIWGRKCIRVVLSLEHQISTVANSGS